MRGCWGGGLLTGRGQAIRKETLDVWHHCCALRKQGHRNVEGQGKDGRGRAVSGL